MTKIKLYTDFLKVEEVSHFGHVFPLIEYLKNENKVLLEFYEIVNDPAQADFLALPLAVEYLWKRGQQKYFYDFLQLAKKANKKLLVFTSGDAGKTINDESVITIRLGGFKSKLPINTFIMPPFIDDPLKKFNLEFSTLKKQSTLVIGFVGHSAKGMKKWSKEFLLFLKGNLKRAVGMDATDFQLFYPSSIKRHQFLKKIENQNEIRTDFIHRPKYRAGSSSEEDRLKTTVEFFENIQNNPFTFCMRGAGNFSVRFYETLALGRIPVLIDTDCSLPFNEEINWQKHAVLLKANEINSFGGRMLLYYQKLDDNEWNQIQFENRLIWEKFFTKEGYFINFQNELKKIL